MSEAVCNDVSSALDLTVPGSFCSRLLRWQCVGCGGSEQTAVCLWRIRWSVVTQLRRMLRC